MATSVDCPICLVPYDDAERRPLRTFCRCKQALCEPCLTQLLQHGNQCPWDRTRWIGRNLIQKFIFATPPNFLQFLQQKAATEELQQQEKQMASKKESMDSKSTSELVAEENVDQQLALLLMLQEETEIARKRKQEEEDLLFAKQLLQSEVKTRIELNSASHSQKNSSNSHNTSNDRGQSRPQNSQSKLANAKHSKESNNLQRFLAAANSSSSSGISIPFQLIEEDVDEVSLDKQNECETGDDNSITIKEKEESVCIIISPEPSTIRSSSSSSLPLSTQSKVSQAQQKQIKRTASTTNSKNTNTSSSSNGILSFLSSASQSSVSLLSPVKMTSLTESNVKTEKSQKNPILEGIEKMKSLPPRIPSIPSFKAPKSTNNNCSNSTRSSSNGIDWDAYENNHHNHDMVEDLTQWDSSRCNSPRLTTITDDDDFPSSKKESTKSKRKRWFSAFDTSDDEWMESHQSPLKTTLIQQFPVQTHSTANQQRRVKRLKKKATLLTSEISKDEMVDDVDSDKEEKDCMDWNEETKPVRCTKALFMSQSSQEGTMTNNDENGKRSKKQLILSDEEDGG